MADRDYFRSAMRAGYDRAVQHIQDCQPDEAVEQIGHAVVKDVRKVLKFWSDCWSQHLQVLTELAGMPEPEQQVYILERLPHTPGKTTEVLRRCMLALTVKIQFSNQKITNPAHELFSAWLMAIAEYELLARLEITSQTGDERRTDCMPVTIERVRELLRQRFDELTAACNAGEDDTQFKWPKPETPKPDKDRPGIQGLPAHVRRSEVKKTKRGKRE